MRNDLCFAQCTLHKCKPYRHAFKRQFTHKELPGTVLLKINTHRGLLGSSFVVGKHWSSQNAHLPDVTCHLSSFLLHLSFLFLFPISFALLLLYLFLFVLCAPLAAGIKAGDIGWTVASFSPLLRSIHSSPPFHLCCLLKSSLCLLFSLSLCFLLIAHTGCYITAVRWYLNVNTEHIEKQI